MLASQGVPHHSRGISPFVCQGQGTECWVIHIKLSGWKRLQMLLFLFLVLSPRYVFSLSPASCQRWLPGRLACAFLKSWKNVAREREVDALAPAPRELLFFIFLAFNSQKYKVNGFIHEVNWFIFSCSRRFVPPLCVVPTVSANIY